MKKCFCASPSHPTQEQFFTFFTSFSMKPQKLWTLPCPHTTVTTHHAVWAYDSARQHSHFRDCKQREKKEETKDKEIKILTSSFGFLEGHLYMFSYMDPYILQICRLFYRGFFSSWFESRKILKTFFSSGQELFLNKIKILTERKENYCVSSFGNRNRTQCKYS